MTLSLTLACLWFLIANLGAILPSRHKHWPLAWVLIGVGIPLLGFICLQHGPWIALAVLGGGMSVLRWPLLFTARWVKRVFVRV